MIECPLCYAPYGSGDANSEAHCFRGCGHVFCHGCIKQLTQVGCPACRWRPPDHHRYADNLSKAVILRLFMDFSDPEVNSLQTKLDDAEKQLASAQLEMKRLKEKQRLETARRKKGWKEERDNLKAELQRATKHVANLTHRLDNEETKSIAFLVSEAVNAILSRHVIPWVMAFCPAWPPSLDTMIWGPSLSSIETGCFESQRPNAPQCSASVTSETRSNQVASPVITSQGDARLNRSLFGVPSINFSRSSWSGHTVLERHLHRLSINSSVPHLRHPGYLTSTSDGAQSSIS